jgi:hypothetical protein
LDGESTGFSSLIVGWGDDTSPVELVGLGYILDVAVRSVIMDMPNFERQYGHLSTSHHPDGRAYGGHYWTRRLRGGGGVKIPRSKVVVVVVVIVDVLAVGEVAV